MIGKPTHLKMKNRNWTACGKQSDLAARDPRDVTCLLCRKTRAWKAQGARTPKILHHVELAQDEDRPSLSRATFDQIQASNEGWGLFDVDLTGFLEIERDDESEVFDSDEQALWFVQSQADWGSQYHAKALKLHYESLAAGERPKL